MGCPGVAMVKKDNAAKTIEEKITEGRRPAISGVTPEEGARLIRAFVAVRNPRVRNAIVRFVEDLS
jgi:hypothetical protein